MSDFRFKSSPENLTGSEVRIIEYFYKNIEQIPFMPIRELAEELQISTATLSRFATHMGYRNLRQLKMEILKAERISPSKKISNMIVGEESFSVSRLMEREIENLKITLQQVSTEEMEKAIKALTQARRVYVHGKGASRGVAYLVEFRLKRYGMDCHHIEASGSEIFEDMAGIQKEDVLILYGFGKVPLETRILLDHAKKIECQVILFTDYPPMIASSGELIVMSCYRGEAQEYHSLTSPSALTDVLLLLLGKSKEVSQLGDLNRLFELKEAYKHQMPR